VAGFHGQALRRVGRGVPKVGRAAGRRARGRLALLGRLLAQVRGRRARLQPRTRGSPPQQVLTLAA